MLLLYSTKIEGHKSLLHIWRDVSKLRLIHESTKTNLQQTAVMFIRNENVNKNLSQNMY